MTQTHTSIPDQERELDLEAGSVHAWEFDLEAGQVVTAHAEQMGIDVVLRLIDPEGETRARMDRPYGEWGPEELTWVADAAGIYRLEVASENPDAPNGRYRFVSSAPREASDEDRRHAALHVELCRADDLRRAGDVDREKLLEARSIYRRTLDGWTELDRTTWRLESLQRLGQMAKSLDDPEAARAAYAEARDLADAEGLPAEALRNENRLVELALGAGDLELAAEHLASAEARSEDLGDPALEAHVATNRATLSYRRGDLDAATRAYLELCERWRILERPLEDANTLQNLAVVLQDQGKIEEALDALERAVAANAAGGYEKGRLMALVHLGEARLRQGDAQGAMESLQAARDAGVEDRLDDLWPAFFHNSLGLARTRLAGEKPEPSVVEEALDSFERAAAEARKTEHPGFADVVGFNAGALLLRADRYGEAFDRFTSALAGFTNRNRIRYEAMARLGIGRALRGRGELSAALEQVEKAVDLVEDERLATTSSSFRMYYLATKTDYFTELVDLLVELHETEEPPAAGPSWAERALEAAERRRARTFLDSIEERANLRKDFDPDLLERERSVLEKLRAIDNELQKSDPGEIPSGESRRRELLLRLESVRGQILEAHPQFSEITRPDPLSAAEIRERVLDHESSLLVFTLGTPRSFVFLVGPPSDVEVEVEVHALESRDTLVALVDDARQQAQTRSKDQTSRRHRAFERLADALLGKIRDRLATERLVIVPDGILELVPFSALRVPNAASENEYLLERHEIVVLPSASSLDALRHEVPRRPAAKWSFVLYGDPVFSAADPRVESSNEKTPLLPESTLRAARRLGLANDLRRLPHTRNEIEAIVETIETIEARRRPAFVGFDARKNAEFLDYLQGSTFVHLATHGLVDPHRPELSALVFSRVDESGEPLDDALLSAHELYSMRLAAEMVVLSACQTGVGPDLPGEGVLGLARAFFYAGAPRLIVSLWNVEDESTAHLMKRFYHHLMVEGLAPPAALRAAQRDLLAEDRWAEPVHWAPFVFFGDWRIDASRRGGDGPIEKDDGGSASLGPSGTDPDYPIDPDDPPAGGQGGGGGAGNGGRGGSMRAAIDLGDFGPDDYVNGLYDTGERLEKHPDGETVLRFRDEILLGPRIARDLQWWSENHAVDDPERLPVYKVDPEKIEESGWAVLFAPGVTDEEKEALSPLLDLRREQAGGLYQEHVLPAGYESARFRHQFETGFGPADPKVFPYYVLIVGDPRELPFELQYGLDVQYAVGRLHLDSAADYERYAASVKRFDGAREARRHAAVFGVGGREINEQFLIQALVDPLTERLRVPEPEGAKPHEIFRSRSDRKADFVRLLQTPPGFLFAAGHGLRVKNPNDPTLIRRKGALVCSDYETIGSVTKDSYFTGDDLPKNLDLRGMIAFFFACYSAGVPSHNDFFEGTFGKPERIAPYPMVSHLSKRMLAQGALAFIGHVERAWGTSFSWSHRELRDGDQVKVFESTCRQLLDGHRVGHAMEWIDQRYAEGAAALHQTLQERVVPDDLKNELPRTRKATQDARNYVVLGDPAVRLPGYG